MAELKKRKIENPKKGTINDTFQKVLQVVADLEKECAAVKKEVERLNTERVSHEAKRRELQTQMTGVQEQAKQLQLDKKELTGKIQLLIDLSAKDEQIITQALQWFKGADESVHAHIHSGDMQGANRQLLSTALNGLLLLQSYLDYRRILIRSRTKDGGLAAQKPVEPNENIRILMGDRVELKQPGPGVNDAPPLASQIRELAKQQGLMEITPFGYNGFKIKS
jgi:uncharacterized small protein (DUF1192 family)